MGIERIDNNNNKLLVKNIFGQEVLDKTRSRMIILGKRKLN
jgi:hypothetical protein